MGTSSVDLRNTLTAHGKNERRFTFAEVVYWLSQYKELALRAVRYAEEADKELEHLRSFANDITLKYEELRKLIDGGSESMSHVDAVTELKALLSSDAELQKLREQKPVRWHVRGNYFHDGDAAILFASMNSMCGAKVDQLYAAPFPAPAVPDGDDFNGTTPHLILCMEALVRLDADGVLVPHGIGRDASKLLSAAANRLRKQPAPSVPEEWRDKLLTEFPLLDDNGLCQENHHCEWTLQQDRKRLHDLLQSGDSNG